MAGHALGLGPRHCGCAVSMGSGLHSMRPGFVRQWRPGELVCASALCIGSALSASAPSFPDCSPKADAHVPYNGTLGPFAPVATQTIIFQGHPIVLIAPQAVGPFPLMVFMHGSTGQIGMYQKNLANYASHGFLVAFPYIKVRCSLSSTA